MSSLWTFRVRLFSSRTLLRWQDICDTSEGIVLTLLACPAYFEARSAFFLSLRFASRSDEPWASTLNHEEHGVLFVRATNGCATSLYLIRALKTFAVATFPSVRVFFVSLFFRLYFRSCIIAIYSIPLAVFPFMTWRVPSEGGRPIPSVVFMASWFSVINIPIKRT